MQRKSHNKHIVIFRLLGLVPLFLTAALNGQTVVLTPPSLIFAGVVVGTTSAPKNISLSNTGNATLLITSIIASASFAETNTCGGSVAAGKNCLISVTFSPTATGSVVGTVTITDNAANSPQTVSLSGIGVAPVTLSPAAHNFGSQTVGTTSSPFAVTLTNNQTTAISISSVAVNGDFAQTNNCGSSLGGKAKCTINVTFTPTIVGLRSGTLTVTDNGGNSPQTTSLSGTGSTLISIAVTPASPSLVAGATQQFTATGTFSNGNNYDLTQSVTWKSRNNAVATISNVAGTKGLANALAGGTATIIATSGKITGSTILTVTSAPILSAIAVAPALPSILLGTTQQFTATGTYSDSSTQDITTSVAWTAGSTAIATISNSGVATSVGVGTSTIGATVGLVASSTALMVKPTASQPVTTYHNDNYRTGWNQYETTLTPANVGSSSFGLLQTVALDDQVEAQPLVVPGVNITAGSHSGTHDVVYVATENNTVYGIDTGSGTVLLSINMGPPVVYPLGCRNNGPNVGINSTPVIDLSSNTMYVMAYTNDLAGPTYRIHALDIGSLTDKVPPVVVAASHVLTDGSTFSFNATYQRQRPALLLANGNVYAGFGSFCDYYNLSRGWLIGWQTGSLSPLASSEVTDIQATSPDDFFLSSIWMSSYGPSADDSGNVLFVTGNSDYSGTTYDGVTDIQESVVKMAPDLSSLLDLFTPADQAILDEKDTDFGSGGVMVLPDQAGTIPHVAVAAGKDGNMYLMNEDNLGGYSPTKNNVLGTYKIGKCWCGPSYYVDPTDLAPRVVTSGATTTEVWELQTSPTIALNLIKSGTVGGGQKGGFFTSISSNGNTNAIIWALSRPISTTQSSINLFAFNPDAGGSIMTALFQAVAGSWPNYTGNANLVPVVANGEVFVASYKQLQIFGLTGSQSKAKKKRN